MIILNEQTKKTFKILGIILGILFIWGILNLFMGAGNRTGGEIEQSFAPSPMNWSQNKNVSNMMGTSSSVAPEREHLINPTGMTLDEEKTEDVSDSSILNDKKIIKNGRLSLRVEKTEEAIKKISQIAKEQEGEVFATNFYERIKGQKNGSMTVKVPVTKFKETIEKIKVVSTQVISESTVGQDVTEKYTDFQAQLKNKRAEEKSFVEILDRAGKIDDVLAVTKQIARVRGEIERLEGKIKYLNSQADMSTIVVSISEDTEVTSISEDWRPWQVVKQSCKELISSIQDFVDGVIRFVIVGIPSLIPFLLFLVIIYWGGKKIYKKIKG